MAGRYLRPEALVQHCQTVTRDLPQRGGVKDYAPDGTWLQHKRLELFYRERHDVLSEERIKQLDHLAVGYWRPDLGKVEVTKDTGKFFFKMGHVANGLQLLYPEEALFLLDQGMMEVYHGQVALSIQEAYPTLLGKEVPIEQYQVYAQLSRLGFILRRYSGSFQLTQYEKDIRLGQHIKQKRTRSNRKLDSLIQDSPSESSPKVSRIEQQDIDSCSSPPDTASAECQRIEGAAPGEEPRGRDSIDSSSDRMASPLRASDSSSLNLKSEESRSKWWLPERPPKTLTGDPTVPTTGAWTGGTGHVAYDFSNIVFPDASGGATINISAPDTSLLPRGMVINNRATSCRGGRLNISKESNDINDASSLEFSVPSELRRRKPPSANWRLYKEDMRQRSLRTVQESPVMHLWNGRVTPLVSPEDGQTTEMVLQKLAIIKGSNVFQQLHRSVDSSRHKVKVIYDVFRPDSKFKKTCITLPDQRVCVTRQDDPLPDLATLTDVSRQSPDGVAVLWAVVDSGDVTFYSFNAADLPTDVYMR